MRSSNFLAAVKNFQDAAKANGGKIPKVAEGVKLHIAAASAREQRLLKMKAAGRRCLRRGVSHSQPLVELVSDWGP